jgi:hypothetical protein
VKNDATLFDFGSFFTTKIIILEKGVSEYFEILHTSYWCRPTSNRTLISKKQFLSLHEQKM